MEVKPIAIAHIAQPEHAHRFAIDPERLRELADSIRVLGLLNPICVREVGLERYEVVAGHRRLLACDSLGWQEIPAQVLHAKPVELELAKLAENTERDALTPVEEAHALTQALDLAGGDREHLAKITRRSLSWVEGRLEILDYSAELLEALHLGQVGLGAAREIARIDDADYAHTLLGHAIRSGASEATVRQWRRAWENDAALATESLLEGDAQPPAHALPDVLIACDRCHRKHPSTEVRNPWLCTPCFDACMSAPSASPPGATPTSPRSEGS